MYAYQASEQASKEAILNASYTKLNQIKYIIKDPCISISLPVCIPEICLNDLQMNIAGESMEHTWINGSIITKKQKRFRSINLIVHFPTFPLYNLSDLLIN